MIKIGILVDLIIRKNYIENLSPSFIYFVIIIFLRLEAKTENVGVIIEIGVN